MNSLLAILSLLFVVQMLVPGSHSTDIPQGYVSYSDVGYAYKINYTQTTWTKSKTRCIEEGGVLAIIDSEEKLAHVIEQATDSSYGISVGFNFYSLQWRSAIDGSVVSGIPWANGHPKLLFMQNCATISRSSNRVEPVLCDKYAYYVCQIEL